MVQPPNSRSKAQADIDTENERRWQAVIDRDGAADGTFYYSVETTGVYCLPSCPSRQARREHVVFHTSRAAAEEAGFRACTRCKPQLPPLALRNRQLIANLCRFIADSEEEPNLQQLATLAELGPSHTQRLFKRLVGVSPKAYAAQIKAERTREQLSQATRVTEAIYKSGFCSTGRFYERAKDVLGMTPRAYRNAGKNEQIRFALGECSLGSVLVAATNRGVCSIQLGDSAEALLVAFQKQFQAAELVGADAKFEQLVARALALVEQPGHGADLPLDIRGTAFQRRVWEALRKIPPGETRSYTQIATAIGSPRSVRAVAGACAANELAVAVPCHRVIRTDGALAGFRWGIERKRELLKREGALEP